MLTINETAAHLSHSQGAYFDGSLELLPRARRPPATRGITAFAPVSRASESGIPVALPMAVAAAIQNGAKTSD